MSCERKCNLIIDETVYAVNHQVDANKIGGAFGRNDKARFY